MTLNGVMALTLRYFTKFDKPAFQHITAPAQERKFSFAISSADDLFVLELLHILRKWRLAWCRILYSVRLGESTLLHTRSTCH